MEKSKKVVYAIIICLIIIAIIVFVVLNKLKKENLTGSDFQETEFEKQDTYQASIDIIKVDNRNKYYAIEKILNTYISYIAEMKGIINFEEFDDEEVKNEGLSKLYNILDPEYISEMDIKKEDLQAQIKKYENYDIDIKEMYIYEKSSSKNLYFIYATIDAEELNLLVKTDSENMTFSIFLDDYIEKKAYKTDMDTKNIDILDADIPENDDNQYKYTNITDEYMATQYMNSLKKNIFNNLEYTYNDLMEEEYRNKRFGDINNFSEYILDNKEELDNIQINKYLVNNYDEYTEYVCVDQYENYYIFKENAIMDYTVMFDTYTIPTTKFKETYNSSEEYKKVQMNIDKFFQMINRHDYKSAYECLAQSYKNNYFKTEEEFENFTKNNLFTYNEVTYKDYEQKGSGLYVFNIELSNLTGESEDIKKVTIVMQLNEDLNFEMSFSI